ncbi:hypothetical protein [Alcanivorax sp.]|uniref:hypothetical protein n=1 Tax=Alcanivorax sp. TaxID=1872427 RepID=UPI002B27AD4B|nr:hypothetical protein [Alcanivorax sp.]
MFSITDLIVAFIEERRANRDRDDALYESLRQALQSTKKYIEEEKEGGRDRQKEYLLSDLWSNAASQVVKYDRDLADRLFQKGDYWLTPETWGEEDIYNAGIAIERIDMEIKEHLLAR